MTIQGRTPPGAVEVWWLTVAPPTTGDRLQRVLAERAAARQALRTAVARSLAVDPDRLQLTKDPAGRPYVATDAGPVAVSLSRAPGRAVAAVRIPPASPAAGPPPADPAAPQDPLAVGVDAEWTGRDLDHDALARRFFPPEEVAELRALPAPAARDRFFEAWTWKEAVLKAAGVGLGAPLPARARPAAAQPAAAQPRTALTVWPEPGYVLTLLTEGPLPPIRWRTWPDQQPAPDPTRTKPTTPTRDTA